MRLSGRGMGLFFGNFGLENGGASEHTHSCFDFPGQGEKPDSF